MLWMIAEYFWIEYNWIFLTGNMDFRANKKHEKGYIHKVKKSAMSEQDIRNFGKKS